MNNAQNYFHPDLWIKYLAGEASPEEALLLDEWASLPDNRAEYESLLRLWNVMGENGIPPVPSSAESWAAIQPFLNKRNQKGYSATIILKLGVAAVLLGLILLFFFNRERRWASDKYIGKRVKDAAITEEAKDSIRRVVLKDASSIALNKNSTVTYDASFGQTERRIRFSGEAFFDIEKDLVKPFVIVTGDVTIQVVGTSFNVRTGAEGSSVEVQVKTGVVKMTAGKEQIVIGANQTGIYFTGSRKMVVKSGIDTNSMSYATGSFRFNDLPLIEACRYLEKSFGVRIEIDKTKFSDCRITAQFDQKPLVYILDVLAATVNATYHRMNEQISIEGKGCQ